MNSMIFHGNPAKLILGGALFLALAFGLAACSRAAEKAQLTKDLDALCRIQQSFEESKKLMKKAAPEELAQERYRRLLLELKSDALVEIVRATPSGPLPREKLEKVAHQAGLTHWACAALK